MPLHQDDQICIQHVLASSLPWFTNDINGLLSRLCKLGKTLVVRFLAPLSLQMTLSKCNSSEGKRSSDLVKEIGHAPKDEVTVSHITSSQSDLGTVKAGEAMQTDSDRRPFWTP